MLCYCFDPQRGVWCYWCYWLPVIPRINLQSPNTDRVTYHQIKVPFFLSNNSLSYSIENERNLKNEISKNIRCLICQGQSIYDSQSDFAISMKIVIEKKIIEGLTEDEIYDYLKNQYGQWILYDPELNKKTFILWILPILLFLLGGAIIVKKIIIKKI